MIWLVVYFGQNRCGGREKVRLHAYTALPPLKLAKPAPLLPLKLWPICSNLDVPLNLEVRRVEASKVAIAAMRRKESGTSERCHSFARVRDVLIQTMKTLLAVLCRRRRDKVKFQTRRNYICKAVSGNPCSCHCRGFRDVWRVYEYKYETTHIDPPSSLDMFVCLFVYVCFPCSTSTMV